MKMIIALLITFTWFQAFAHPNHCPMEINDQCETIIKSNIPWWEQRDQQILQKIKKACTGNTDTICLNTAMNHIPWWEQDEASDFIKIATSCQQTTNSCVSYIQENLSRWDFDSLDEVTKTAKACQRSDTDCIKIKCESRHYSCTRSFDLYRAARECYQDC